MTLQDAIDWLMRIRHRRDISEFDIGCATTHEREAIATILNAVVKGELK